MTQHVFEATLVDTDYVGFTCQTCQFVINFVKPSVGSPNPVVDQSAVLGYRVPDNVADWAGECNG